jgi:hypothetical protein
MITSGKLQRRFEVHFGVPDYPAGTLRELLPKHVAMAPSGGVIDGTRAEHGRQA